MLYRSLPVKLPASYFHGFVSVQHAVSLPPSEAFRELFARFRVRPACCIAPSQWSFPQAICTVSCPSSMLYRSLPAKLSPSYFHGFVSVQHAVSLPPSEAFPKLFARFRVRPACCIAPSQQSFSPSYLHGFMSVQHAVSLPPSEAFPKLYARFRVRPACCIAPSQQSFSPSYFYGFMSVQHAVSLPPGEAFRKLFVRFRVRPACCIAPSQRSFPQAICTVSCPSSMLYRSLPVKLSASYLHGFMSVQHAVSLSPSEAFRKLFARFRVRPACCIAPSRWSFPQAICTVSCPSSMLYRSLPAKLSPSYFHGFVSVQHAVSLPPSEAFPKLFARFRVRPACCITPSQRSFPQAICTVSCPSSMLYRSLPAKLSASYLHRFVSVQHAVSLSPGEAFRKLFARFRVRPACCIAPSR